jgi:alpha-beta hydrolase superfamily lysophospholipase
MRRVLQTSLAALLAVTFAGSVSAQPQGEVEYEVVRLKAEDGGRPRGQYYYARGTKPRVAVLIMHPRGDETGHFILEPLAKAGYGAMGMASRSEGMSGIHEELLLDVAAGIKWLKTKGVEKVVLAGHSGGGSLMAYYQAQAEAAPADRVHETPAGDPPDLGKFDLPPAVGLITLNAAEGEGLHIAHHLDPSVTDENDPFSYDPSLDLYNPDNGFRVPPEVTRYTPEFVAKVEKAQQERARRLVEIARGYIREQNFYRDLMKSPGYKNLTLKEQLMIERRAAFERPMLLYRTRADPRYFDLTIDPNDRTLGHYFAGIKIEGINRSDVQNWSKEDRLTTVSPRAFLSTESIASNARMWDNLKKIKAPVLVVNSSADPGIHPSEAQKTFESAGTKDKEKVWIIGGNHGFVPEGPKAGEGDQREQTTDAIGAWLVKRFPK